MSDGYSEITRGIRVTVTPFYLDDRSKPDAREFFWAYKVEIANHGTRTVQLMRRTWHITDAMGRTQQVHGPGVVGEQPVIEPGEAFEYTSGTPLSTPSGFMHGQYHMVETATAEPFDVAIPAFSLDSPYQDARLN
jgi:ApaG protein